MNTKASMAGKRAMSMCEYIYRRDILTPSMDAVIMESKRIAKAATFV